MQIIFSLNKHCGTAGAGHSAGHWAVGVTVAADAVPGPRGRGGDGVRAWMRGESLQLWAHRGKAPAPRPP